MRPSLRRRREAVLPRGGGGGLVRLDRPPHPATERLAVLERLQGLEDVVVLERVRQVAGRGELQEVGPVTARARTRVQDGDVVVVHGQPVVYAGAGGEEDVQWAHGGADWGVPGHGELYARVTEQVVQPGLQEHPAQVQQHEGARVLALEALGRGLQTPDVAPLRLLHVLPVGHRPETRVLVAEGQKALPQARQLALGSPPPPPAPPRLAGRPPLPAPAPEREPRR